MSLPANLVTIHPYFKIHHGQEDKIQAVLDRFVATTRSESKCLFYDFTVLEDQVFCREGYAGAEGALDHLENVREVIEEMLTHSDLARLELHGPEEEIDKLRVPLAHLSPAFFVRRCGLD